MYLIFDMKIVCAIPIRRIDGLFLTAIDSLFNLDYEDIVYLLYFDNVEIRDDESIKNWSIFETFLLHNSRWIAGRVTLLNSLVRNGLIKSWNESSRISSKIFENSDLFFWASDHDLWHKKFLNHPIEIFTKMDDISLVVPQYGILKSGHLTRLNEENEGMKNSISSAVRDAGFSLYGVFKLGEFPKLPNTLLPDRLFICLFLADRKIIKESSSQIKYIRRYDSSEKFSVKRQKRNLWPPGGKRFYNGLLPWWLSHIIQISYVYLCNRALKHKKTYSFTWYAGVIWSTLLKIKPLKRMFKMYQKLKRQTIFLFRKITKVC
jgi:hypothetical protein